MPINVTVINGGNGLPLTGAVVTYQYKCTAGFGNGATISATTNADGLAVLNTGCNWGASGTLTVTAPGYQTYTSQVGQPFGWEPTTNLTVTLMPTANSSGGNCPNGYVMENGQCVLAPYTNLGDQLSDIFKNEWLVILIVVTVIAIVGVIVYRGVKG